MEAERFPSLRQTAQDLTKAPGFSLGPLTVDPPARRIGNGESDEMLEPRVMRLLVVLGRNPGQVISRDDLIEYCWDGLIVGDNAIKRAIWRLRHVLDDLSGGAVRLETITKVGFRILVTGPSSQLVPSSDTTSDEMSPFREASGDNETDARRSKWSRRAAIAGVLGLGASSATAYGVWRFSGGYFPNPRALELYTRGLLMRRSASPDNALQAISYFKQAVAVDPDFAAAWGALAISYSMGKLAIDPKARIPASPSLVRSAARRALALDPDQAEGQLALILIEPQIGRWLEHERRFRSIVRTHPDHPLANGMLGLLLENVGRTEEAIATYRHMLSVQPMLPLGWMRFALALHSAGRDHEADEALDEGFSHFPSNILVWIARFEILIGTERYVEAAAFVRDPRTLPPSVQPRFQETSILVADALATGEGADKAVSRLRQLFTDIAELPRFAPLLAGLGEAPALLDALEAYCLGGEFDGRRIPRPGASDGRQTLLLFSPEVLALRGDPRFGILLRRIGLEDYWRQSGRQPDFRLG